MENNIPAPKPEAPVAKGQQNSQTQQPAAPVAATNTNKSIGFVGLMNSIPMKFASLLKKKPVVGVTPQEAPHLEVPVVVKKNYKKMIILGGIGLIVILLLATGILYYFRPKPVALVPTPTPESLAPIGTPIPTKYATDSAVLSIEENSNVLQENLGNVDLDEENIKPRSLDFNVSF